MCAYLSLKIKFTAELLQTLLYVCLLCSVVNAFLSFLHNSLTKQLKHLVRYFDDNGSTKTILTQGSLTGFFLGFQPHLAVFLSGLSWLSCHEDSCICIFISLDYIITHALRCV